MKVLVTGGAGYIGSTTCNALRDAGHTPVLLDSLVNGREQFTRGHLFYRGDIADRVLLRRIFQDHPDIGCAIHFAALIVVPDSVAHPYEYYRENVLKSLELFKALAEEGCTRIIFSSSASVYGNVDISQGYQVGEDAPTAPSSPYARTKLMMEMVLEDMCTAYDLKGMALRYFNPIGADPQMRSGAYDPAPSHVLGKMLSVATGTQDQFCITGVDWPTRDGSGIRDYIHVWDLARAHVLAVEHFDSAFAALPDQSRYLTINLGTGNGVTVKELVAAFERVYGAPIRKCEAPPRPGDVAGAYASNDRARTLLHWQPQLSIDQAIADALRWTGTMRKQVLGY